MKALPLSWFGIVRLGLVQTALGAIVVLATSIMNRVMVIELALPAVVPAALIALHYMIQVLRPSFGYASDRGGRRTPWIVGGMVLLGVGAVTASLSIALMQSQRGLGILCAVLSFVLIGVGVGTSGTALLVLLAQRCSAQRRPVAATVVWLMMIAGFVLTTIVAGHYLDPFSMRKLVQVTSAVAAIAWVVTICAVWRLEGSASAAAIPAPQSRQLSMPSFRVALKEVWQDRQARAFTIFVFVSMLAYSAEELILDPFSAAVYGFSPGQSTQLSGALHSGVFVGMLMVAIAASAPARLRLNSLRVWMIAGCVASSIALLGVGLAGLHAPVWPLRGFVTALGIANGAFAVAAIGCMMQFAGLGQQQREGMRMGLWGAAQGIAFGVGGLLASSASDLARHLIAPASAAYATVFAVEATLFAIAAYVALRLGQKPAGAKNEVRSKRDLSPLQLGHGT